MLILSLKAAHAAAGGVTSAAIEANDYVDSIIDHLKADENLTVNRVGRVLEGTKFGFLMGFVTPSILTATGVALTSGNLVAAVGGGVATLANPIAGVCAAVGAVYFGWKALSDDERREVLAQVGDFLQVGAEQIKAVVKFALGLMTELMSADNFKEIKGMVAAAASAAGRHLSDITHSIKDKTFKAAKAISDTASNVYEAAGSLGTSASNVVQTGASQVAETAKSSVGVVAETAKTGAVGVSRAASKSGEKIGTLFRKKEAVNSAKDRGDG